MKHNITERRLIALGTLLVSLLLSPVVTLAAPANQEAVVHVVRRGETLSRIAGQYGVSVDDLIRANNIADPDRIYDGQPLTIPASGSGTSGTGSATTRGGTSGYTGSGSAASICDTYTVRLGDSLSSIARQYGVTVSSIQQANGLWGPLIWPWLKLRIPCGGGAPAPAISSSGDTQAAAPGCPLVNGRYQVRSGDTLYTIARRCHTSVTALQVANSLRSGYIWVGQWLAIAVPMPTPVEVQWWGDAASPTLPSVFFSTPTPTPTPSAWPSMFDSPATATPTPTPTPVSLPLWTMPTPSG
ncbi:MAG: LysM peptidoglycan-binding domain-containing protein [Chloroflexi bacterium]|nr:LysM peptidoglycan-binding domain-containing protein [Chloroflexota bacterium]